MKRFLRWVLFLLVVAGVAAFITYRIMVGSQQSLMIQAQELQSELKTKESNLLGHTAYTTYLTVGKQALAGQAKLLTATVTREEGVSQVVHRNFLPGLTSTGTVAIWYKAEYAFGFDLRPSQYDIRPSSNGIEVIVKKPMLVTTPSVTNLRYKILSGGVLTDEKSAALKLYEKASIRAKQQGAAMAGEPAVLALCEKSLIEFLRNFLSKQPGVRVVPHISIVYKDA
jgi:hypothetical protein